MTISEKIKRKLSKYPNDKAISFKELRSELGADINVDSLRKALHRLHRQGVITINSRGQFKKEDPFKIYLFVYGSLKKGFQNNDILSEANYISKAKTTSKFAMYKERGKDYPYMIRDSSTGQEIDGELYEITRKDVLDKIDIFEGAPDYFKRTNLVVNTRSREVKAKTYILSTPRVPSDQIPLKSWTQNSIKLNIDFDAYFASVLN